MNSIGNEERTRARNLALKRLTVREYSVAEMRSYLKKKGVSEELSEDLVAELQEDGSLSDLRFAKALARDQSFRQKGPLYILAKLRAKGVSMDLKDLRGLLGEMSDIDESEAIRRILERRYPKASSDPKEFRRAYQGLLRRGYSSELIRKCLGNFLSMGPRQRSNPALL